MLKISRNFVLFAVVGFLLMSQTMMAQEGVSGNLVSAQWLEKNLKNPDLLILDASAQSYAAEHIHGAVSVNVFQLFSYGLGGAPVTVTEKLFQSWGVSSGKKIILYDMGGTYLATRIFFDLVYRGYPAKDLFLLDGGLTKWKKDGLPVTKEPTPAPKNGTFKIEKLNTDVEVDLPEFLAGSGDLANHALVEGLSPDWHFGETHPFSKAGHIPNGIMAQVDDFYNPDKTFKSPEEIKKIFAYLGIHPEQQLYTYCGGGGAANVPFFAARYIANFPKVKLYPESEFGWLADERDLPYWTYDAPYLMRESSWVQFKDNMMLRTFIDPHVSI